MFDSEVGGKISGSLNFSGIDKLLSNTSKLMKSSGITISRTV